MIQKGFIDLELIKVKVKISARGVLSVDNSVVSTQPMWPTDNERGLQTTNVAATQPTWPTDNEIDLKPLPDKDSSRPKINKTYKDFLKSLSETERESFVKFGEEEAGKMPSPPRLTQKWIENNWEDLHSLWQKSPGKITHPKWGDDPRREEWLQKIRLLGFGGFLTENLQEEKERRDFYIWANKENLIWGVES